MAAVTTTLNHGFEAHHDLIERSALRIAGACDAMLTLAEDSTNPYSVAACAANCHSVVQRDLETMGDLARIASELSSDAGARLGMAKKQWDEARGKAEDILVRKAIEYVAQGAEEAGNNAKQGE